MKKHRIVEAPQDVLGLIGNTPLLRLGRVGAGFPRVEFYAKVEWQNPGGSIKDRPALNIVLEAERAGLMSRDNEAHGNNNCAENLWSDSC